MSKAGTRRDLNIYPVRLGKSVNRKPSGSLANLGNGCWMQKNKIKTGGGTHRSELALTENGG